MTNTVKIKAVDENHNLLEATVHVQTVYTLLAEINGLEENQWRPNHWYPKGTVFKPDHVTPLHEDTPSYYLTEKGFVKREVKDYSPRVQQRPKYTYDMIEAPDLFKTVVSKLRDPYTDIRRTNDVPRAETILIEFENYSCFINLEAGSILIRIPGDTALKVIRSTGSQRQDIQMLAKSRYNQQYGSE